MQQGRVHVTVAVGDQRALQPGNFQGLYVPEIARRIEGKNLQLARHRSDRMYERGASSGNCC